MNAESLHSFTGVTRQSGRTMDVSAVLFIFAALVSVCRSASTSGAEKVKADYDPNWHRELKDYGTTWMYFPDGKDLPQVAYLSEGDSRSTPTMPEAVEPDEVTFTLYTRNQELSEILDPDDPQTVWDSSFNPKKPTKFIAHGWKSSGDSDTVRNIKDAYLDTEDVNVVGVDWSSLAGSNFYPWSKSYTNPVGRRVADLIKVMVGKTKWEEAGRGQPKQKNKSKKKANSKKQPPKMASIGANLSDIHLVGHSLGAHLMGYAGKHLSPFKVGRITGLDPAMPLFEILPGRDGHLDESDADFVEIIHTCAGALGYLNNIGHVDFYPNGGSPVQPGCCCRAELAEACSHGRSHQYFAESIRSKNFIAVECPNWDSFVNGSCANGPTAIMGEYTPTSTRGVYYLSTKDSKPYAWGKEGLRVPEEYL